MLINFKSVFQPKSGAIVPTNDFAVQSTKKVNAFNSFLQGDFLGSALNLIGNVKGLFDGSNHRDTVTSRWLQEALDSFKQRGTSISSINRLYRELYDWHAYESTKDGSFEKKFLDALIPITKELTSNGYTFKMASMKTHNRDSYHDYPVWTAPTKSVYNSVKNAVGENKKTMGIGTLATLGFGLFALLGKK